MKPNQASATAYLIAESTVLSAATAELRQFIPARAAELSARFLNLGTPRGRIRRALKFSAPGRMVMRVMERATIPGIKLHYALRKRFLEETTRAAIADGCTQVVVLGAGFDTLALRLSREFPLVQFFEVDHPATQRKKIAALDPATITANECFLPLELDHVGGLMALTASGYKAAGRALFVAEGLLMYFTAAEVRDLFRFVHEHSGAGSRFAFTFMEGRPDGRIGFRDSSRFVDFWLRHYGEPFKWSLALGRLPAFLQENGFDLREVATAETFRERYLDPCGKAQLTLAAGECVAVAGRN